VAAIRPFQRKDLSQVCDLYERTVRHGSGPAPAGLCAGFERVFLDCPWSDPEVPSLVYEQPDENIVGFLGVYNRRMVFNGKPCRLACGGQLATSPEGRAQAAGVLLMHEFLKGPQDVSITDGPTLAVQRIWGRLGGDSQMLGCIRWTRILRPCRFATLLMSRRRRLSRLAKVIGPLSPAGDVVASRLPPASFRPTDSYTPPVPLTSEMVIETLPSLYSKKALRPDYDLTFLDWLFQEMSEARSRGKLHKWALRSDKGEVLGWYVYYLTPRDVAQVQQVAAREDSVDKVVDHMFEHMWREGAAGAQGRVEHDLLPALTRHRSILGYGSELTLVHSRDPEILRAVHSGNTFLTRQEGEWWVSFHCERY
jgi:hypothetical protein